MKLPKSANEIKLELIEEAVDNVLRFDFGDHGPFGWNDPVGVQQAVLEKLGPNDFHKFVELLLAKYRVSLLQFFEEGP